MVSITKGEVIQTIANKVGLQVSDGVPTQLANVVSPVIDVEPAIRCNKTSQQSFTTSNAGGTLFSTRSDVDTYLIGMNYSYIKDATCDTAIGVRNITAILDKRTTAQTILSHAVLTTTAQQEDINVMFAVPLKLKKGTTGAVSISTDTYTLGLRAKNITLWLYEDES